MRASVRDHFPRFYDERQTAAAVMHIAHLDAPLIADRTYFVHTSGDEIVKRFPLTMPEPANQAMAAVIVTAPRALATETRW